MGSDLAAAATLELWERLARPFSPAGAVEAMTGLTPARARQIVGVALAAAPEADELLGAMHHIVRSLAIATTSRPVRTQGEIRGPVLWGETLAARGASPAAHDTFISMTPSRAYDTDENRVLVHALRLVRDAARQADLVAHDHDDTRGRAAHHNGGRAARALEHRTLASIAAERPTARALRRARTGTRARSYWPALAVIERAAEPLGADDVVELCDDHTRRQHGLLLALHDRLRARDAHAGAFRVEAGTLRAGPLRYLHRYRAESDGLYGVLLGNLLLDVPDGKGGRTAMQVEADLVDRSFGHPALIVLAPQDVDRAIDLARLSSPVEMSHDSEA